jgi:hypothetical protein
MALVKIAHFVSAVLGLFHLAFAGMLSQVFKYSRPSHPDYAAGAVIRWSSRRYHTVYITAHDQMIWNAMVVVGVVCLLVCAALTFYLKLDARRNGRTTLY